LATKADLTVPAAAGNLANIDALGQYQDSTYKVDDVAVAAATVLYSSLKLDGELATKADLSVPAAAGNLANIDALGQYGDSTYKVDDVAVAAATVLYSSLKLLTKSYIQGTFSGTVTDTSADVQLTATASVDIYSEFAANFFTATRAGRYIVTAGVLFQPATMTGDGYTQIAIQAGALKFFDRTLWNNSALPVADGLQNNVCAVALLTTGQTIDFRVWQFTGTNRTILPVASKFTISEM
jgi:flagellar basal body rod protein FlgC